MKKPLLTLIFLLLNLMTTAQLRGHFQSITVDDGLAQNSVWDVLQDHRGYLWIATSDGINRYDGYNFKHFKHRDQDSSTIAGISNFRLFEDTENNLWVNHERGVCLYNNDLETFKNIYADTEFCNIIGVDAHKLLWIKNSEGDLLAIDIKQKKVTKKIVLDFEKSENPYESIIDIGNQFIFQSKLDQFVIFDKTTNKIDVVDIPFQYKGALGKLNDSTVIFTHQGHLIYLNVYTKKIEIRKIKHADALKPIISFSSYFKKDNLILIGSNQGIFTIDPQKCELINHQLQFGFDASKSFPFIYNIESDKQGNIWLLTNGNGLKRYSPYENKFKHYSTSDARTNMTKAVVSFGSNQLAVGLFAEGLIIYNGEEKFKQYPFKSLPTDHSDVLAIGKYDSSQLIIVNKDRLCLFDTKSEKIVWSKALLNRNVALPALQKSRKNLWWVSDLESIYKLDSSLTLKEVIKAKANQKITTFAIDKLNDDLWIGTYKGLLIAKQDGQIKSKSDWSYYIKTICQTKDKWYIGTQQGLLVCDSKGEIITKFSIINGLVDDFIYGVLEDNSGQIWFSHNKGLSRLNPKDNTFIHFGLKDGLQSNEFNTGSYYKDEKGLLYFGGVNGVNVIDPENLPINPNIPQIAINEINLSDEPYKTDSSYNEIKQLTLAYNENTLSFDFSALEFSQPNQNTYSYYLEGYDKDWIESGNKHFARYANLPAGNYTFKIKAANGDEVWINHPRELPITIIPPIWQRAWFIIVISIVGVGVGALAIWVFIRRQSEKLRQELEIQHKLELERIRISRDLHDNVGAQLSYLITNMEWMAEHPEALDKEEEKKRLTSLSEAGRQAILTLRQTIWAISQNALTVEEFADRYKQYVLKMVEFNKHIHIKFEEHIEGETQLSPAVALNLFRVCQEAFNNTLKHSEAQNVLIQFYSNKKKIFKYVITDDGLGFDFEKASSNGHYGLKNMKARAEESQASINFETKAGKGTIVTLEV